MADSSQGNGFKSQDRDWESAGSPPRGAEKVACADPTTDTRSVRGCSHNKPTRHAPRRPHRLKKGRPPRVVPRARPRAPAFNPTSPLPPLRRGCVRVKAHVASPGVDAAEPPSAGSRWRGRLAETGSSAGASRAAPRLGQRERVVCRRGVRRPRGAASSSAAQGKRAASSPTDLRGRDGTDLDPVERAVAPRDVERAARVAARAHHLDDGVLRGHVVGAVPLAVAQVRGDDVSQRERAALAAAEDGRVEERGPREQHARAPSRAARARCRPTCTGRRSRARARRPPRRPAGAPPSARATAFSRSSARRACTAMHDAPACSIARTKSRASRARRRASAPCTRRARAGSARACARCRPRARGP